MTIPESHLVEGQKLTADAEVDLYQINLATSPVIYRFKNSDTVAWQGAIWEGIALTLSGDSHTSDDENSRPTLRMINPAGVFNAPAFAGLIDRALVIRKRVLRPHLDANANIFQQRMWYVDRVKELVHGKFIGLELRTMTDGPAFQLPLRMYIPPEFPMVSL